MVIDEVETIKRCESFFYPKHSFYLRDKTFRYMPKRHISAVYATATWLAGWVAADTQFQGEPFSGGIKYTGM